ncbi:MAG: hypothetical protein QOK90_10080 [Nitrososphaeraceae archaeon]|nr:hypothetical protein [Nitrososphaeraceae archaeon]
MSVPLGPLNKKRLGLYDELVFTKLMKYYGFEKREELLNFLKTQHIED